ncbi:MAG TPA: DUF2934 domain-containing protein [Polyangiaceae bacterium]|nr:DUF2934 domain-containing protein [Polyangiaceae bacterium]
MSEDSTVTEHTIRRRAYQRWLERGSPPGSPERDWLEAERELLAEAQGARGQVLAPRVTAPAVAATVTATGRARRRAPRAIVTRAAAAPAARLLAALVPQATPASQHASVAPAQHVAGSRRR